MSDLPPYEREVFNHSLDGTLWPYLVQQPAAAPKALLLYLHGHYGDHYQGMTPGPYDNAFGKLRAECARRKWAYVSAWYGGNSWMGPLAEQGLAELIGLLRERWPGRRLYLSGGSMGGSAALVFAVRRPELLEGVMARCPVADVEGFYAWAAGFTDHPTLQNITRAIRLHYTLDGHDLAEQLRLRSALTHWRRLTFPVHLCHGSADELIPVGPCRELARRLREEGRPVHYEEIAGGGHDAPVLGVNWTPALDFLVGSGEKVI